MLDYEQNQAPHEKAIIKQCLLSGREYPKAITNAPVLEQEHAFYYFTYMQLVSCRNYEYGPIPYSAIRDYCYEYSLETEQTERVVNVVQQVDALTREKDIAHMNKRHTKGGKPHG